MFEDLKWLCYVYSIQVAKWMRPMVRSNKNKNVFSIVFVIPSALDVIHLAKLDDPPTEKNVRDLVSKADGAKGEYKSAFQGHERKISCVKVPRHNFSNEILLQIDEHVCIFVFLLACMYFIAEELLPKLASAFGDWRLSLLFYDVFVLLQELLFFFCSQGIFFVLFRYLLWYPLSCVHNYTIS